MTRTDVVIIGGGVIGASAAFHLARAGMKVVVIDRTSAPGLGSTGRATGGFRLQFGTAMNIRLSLLSYGKLGSFEAETGVSPGFVRVGYLFLATSEAELAVLREANALQHREGVEAPRIVGEADVAKLNPFVARAGVVGAAWSPDDGIIAPLEILRGYREAAERSGVLFRWNESPRALTMKGDRIEEVVTDHDRYATGIVVNAAGAWAADVARLAGVKLDVTPLRRQVAVTEPTSALPNHMPLTIWTNDGFHLRVRDDRVLLLRPTPGAADPWATHLEPAWLDDITKTTRERVPLLADVALDRTRSWAGLYEMSPDHHVLLGRAPGCPDLLLANGSSGHGVMHAPALGQLVAEIATERTPSIDIHALRPTRFAEGDPVRGPTLL